MPTGLICARRWCPQLRLSVALDLIAPVLVIVWTVGRLLGPQLMYQGGGNPTHAWYGMAYAGQAGRRVPVPIFQALEDSVVYVVTLWVERRIARRGGPIGIVATTAVTLYGAARFNDEYVLLPHSTGGDKAVLIAISRLRRRRSSPCRLAPVAGPVSRSQRGHRSVASASDSGRVRHIR